MKVSLAMKVAWLFLGLVAAATVDEAAAEASVAGAAAAAADAANSAAAADAANSATADAALSADAASAAASAAASGHTNNWAVLVSTLRFWFNYRHMANVLSLYRTVKRLGIPDSQIILMLSDDIACNPRNAFPGTVFNNMDQAIDLYGDLIEVDYRGYEVTVENFVRLLTDRWDANHPRLKRLLTDENSNIFIYLTGHGGNEFLKFQDAEEISAYDIANAFEQMYEKRRYNEILFMIDTCQANTMYKHFYLPNILLVGSLALDESLYLHHSDMDVGVAVIDRFTYYTLEFLERIERDLKVTMDKLFAEYTFENVHSNPGINTALFGRALNETLLTDFFGSVQNARVDGEGGGILAAAAEQSMSPAPKAEAHATLAAPRASQRNASGGALGFAAFGNVDAEERKTLIDMSATQTQVFGGVTVAVLAALWAVAK
jgi:phosphatidylinositol glycan class K